MVRFSLFIALILSLTSGILQASDSDPVAKVTIPSMTKDQYLEFRELGMDVVETSGDAVTIIASQQDIRTLRAIGIEVDIDIPDLSEYYRARSPQAFGGFKSHSQIVAFMDSICSANPTIFTAKFSIGKSIENRDLWVVKVSDNPNLDEDEPEVFYNALIHAREPIGPATLMNIMTHLATNYGVDPEITSLVDSRELFFLPMINPDGYAYNESSNPDGGGMWRKNRRVVGVNVGVDLNRNFSFAWGYDNYGSSTSPSSATYRGTASFSEPETAALRDFVASRNFSVCNNIHSYSNLFIWPYGYDRIFTHQEDFFTTLGDSLSSYNGYAPGIGWTLYPTNGAADDWMWGDTITKPRFVSLTTEIGTSSDGFWPSDTSRIPILIAENLEPNLFLARIADNPFVLAPPARSTLTLADSVAQNFLLSWSTLDTINPPVSYNVYELTGKQTVQDDAESDHGYWTALNMDISSTYKHAGMRSWRTLNYNGQGHWLLAKRPYLVKTGDSLVFWMWYDLETSYDYFYAQVSIDGGFDFINLSGNLTTNTDPYNMNYGNGITGSSSGLWRRAVFSLTPYASQQVLIRLSMFADGNTLGQGVYIDDIGNIDKFGVETLISSGSGNPYINFTNKSPGSYWYSVTGIDAQGQISRTSDFDWTTVFQQYVVGDLSGDGLVDLVDLSSLISFLTTGVPEPTPLERANFNCSGIVDISDLSSMVSYLTNVIPKPTCL